MKKEDELMLKASIKKLLRQYRYRLAILNRYRDMDINKEILHCMNEITKLKQQLKEIRKDE